MKKNTRLKRIWPLYLILIVYALYLISNVIQEEVFNKPIIVLPENGDKIPYNQINLKWNEVEEASSYEVQIAETRDFENPTYHQNTQYSSYLLNAALDIDKKYYWRVRAVINEEKKSWSFPKYFYTEEVKDIVS
ncbi:MAG: hypothetical protein AABW46_04650 [Nanoarchaeota archaeon]